MKMVKLDFVHVALVVSSQGAPHALMHIHSFWSCMQVESRQIVFKTMKEFSIIVTSFLRPQVDVCSHWGFQTSIYANDNLE